MSPAFISGLACQVQAALTLILSTLLAKLTVFDVNTTQVPKALVSSVHMPLPVEATKRMQAKTAGTKGVTTLSVTLNN